MSEATTKNSTNPYQEWVEAIVNRSKEAWAELAGAYSTRLRHDVQISLRKWGLPLELTEDVVQETWLRAIRNIDTFVWEDEEKFYRWLRVISKNCIYELQRTADRALSLDDEESDDSDINLDRLFDKCGLRGSNVEDLVILRERMVAVERALKTLKAEEREIYLRWLMGERPRKLALDYQRPVGTISRLLQRASKKIRPHLLDILPTNHKDNDYE